MNASDLGVLLRATGAAVAVPDAPVDRIVAAGRRRVRRRRAAEVLGTVALVVAVVTAVLLPLGSAERGTAPAAGPHGCGAAPPRVLPEWARAGFSPPDQLTDYVLGDRGEIAAVLFGSLTSPPAAGRNNKILWVARTPAGRGPLTITARRADDPRPAPVVQVIPDGPGPSTVDLPGPGCWTLDLSWAGGTDTVGLRYDAG